MKNAPQSTRSGLAAPEPALAATHNGDAGAGASVSPEEVRACSRQLASGVSVVTTCDAAGRPYGLTMSAVLCVSLDPALFAICIGEESETLGPLLERGAFAINVLGAEQEALARTFASKGGRDKFRRVAYHSSPTVQLPVLRGSLAVVECSLVAAYPGGDHRLVVGKVEATRLGCGAPLLRYDGRYLGVDVQEYAADRAA